METVDDENETGNDEYDSPWKEAVELYFPEFMAFYFPAAYAEIDWTQEHVFLDQELREVVQDAELGKRFVDKLVRVSSLKGEENWIYIHLEIQASRQAEFAKRMFVYNYRLFDRYDKPIASLALLADDHAHWKPSSYEFNILGCKHRLEFPVAKLTDYQGKLDDLLAGDNAFALITAAHILTQQTKKQAQARFEAKLRLIRFLYQLKWDKLRIIKLFLVLDWLLKLPADLEQKIGFEIVTIEEGLKMRYISSVERIGIEKGRLEGKEEGRVEGRMEGRLEGEATLLRKLLEYRFGCLPVWAAEKLACASPQALEAWAKAVLTAPGLESVFDAEIKH